ncbi:unnamed protein product [Rotaria magnacalcarata]|uniref:Uncharacterized protein n=1 Tax=Rotaria magnacalcarata TaxID=392030 RepID=A0A8S2KE69_9BILA|nr:unnamed protein product [Rotaria magnacalcarata]CAF3851916.1 unnamed protein product [Rotaria magnacalcarata]CAF3879510.1 unnamed protein product [Rotaria magnacalcarata]
MMKNLYIQRSRSIRFKIYTFMVITVKDLYITRFRNSYLDRNYSLRFKTHTFIVLAVYDLRFIHSCNQTYDLKSAHSWSPCYTI